jgi:hypothetical protein
MNYTAVFLGLILMVAAAVCLSFYKTNQNSAKWVLIIIIIVLFIFIVISFCKSPQSLRMHGTFLSYSTKMVGERKPVILYIPLFLILMIFFLGLAALEFAGYWTVGNVTFDPAVSLYYKL